ncbi:MAG: hypothetical protein R3A44_24245 [Caldilineaceae bacterium]
MTEILEIKRSILQPLIHDAESFYPGVAPPGYMLRMINEAGYFDELGLRFTAADLSFGQLYAGLAVLCRDMTLYLDEQPRADAMLFNEVVALVNREESVQYGAKAFPYYAGLNTDMLPGDLAVAAATDAPSIIALGSRDIVHEWTFKPGKRLLLAFYARFGPKLKETLCGKDGPYELIVKRRGKQSLLGQEELPYVIVSSVLTAGVSPATFWYPLAVYLGILLLKAGLKAYCEPVERDQDALAQALSVASTESKHLVLE